LCYDGTVPKVILVANQKGGVGKTTTSVYLAAIAARTRGVTLIDCDQQGSAAEWLDELSIPNLECIEAPSPRTLRVALSRVGDDRLVVIDTPPGSPEILMTVIEVAADAVVVIPSRTGILEVARVALTLRLVGDIPRYILLVAANTQTRAYRETVAAWQSRETIIGTIRARTAISAGLELDRPATEQYAEVLDRLLAHHNISHHNT
jgi:chromosome partitioning protein